MISSLPRRAKVCAPHVHFLKAKRPDTGHGVPADARFGLVQRESASPELHHQHLPTSITVTDVSGTGETIALSQNGSSICFNVAGRTYSLNGGGALAFPFNVALSGITSITINTAAAADVMDIGAFTAPLPSLYPQRWHQ